MSAVRNQNDGSIKAVSALYSSSRVSVRRDTQFAPITGWPPMSLATIAPRTTAACDLVRPERDSFFPQINFHVFEFVEDVLTENSVDFSLRRLREIRCIHD